MKRFRKVYLEISNICNLHCRFCPGTKRKPQVLQETEFLLLLQKLRPWTDYLYFHLMGEPLCHPDLKRYLQIAGEQGFKVILTTNGTLLEQQREILLAAPALHKVNISLHAFEANDLRVPFETYLDGCLQFAAAAEGKKIISLRLWNNGGENQRNRQILAHICRCFPQPWKEDGRGTAIGERVFLEYGDKFDWPDLTAQDNGPSAFCYGLRDQLGVLCDGTVVPCCLDHDGDIALGNLLREELADILDSPRAKNIYDGFSSRTAVEDLCRRCGYARRFQ